jgi:hypothetical protein
MDGFKQQDSTHQNDSTLGFKWIMCKARTGTKLTSFQNKKLPITNYVQTQTSVIFSSISMIIYVL